MTPIADIQVYTNGMRKSMEDKLWWLDIVSDSEINSVFDYGCADGTLLDFVHGRKPELNLYGYDFNSDMLKLAKIKVPNGEFISSMKGICIDKNTLMVCSSVFHEIHAYSDNIEQEYNNIFNRGAKYIAIRDMFVPKSVFGENVHSGWVDMIRYNSAHGWKVNDFEKYCGPLSVGENFIQFFLTYRYEQNWDREVRENYLFKSFEEFLYDVPKQYEIVYAENYTLPFIREQVEKDFGIVLDVPTHGKILLKLK